tara:strand:+ start:121 stop:516 length:396 start_codon:yes stop_codon:yes gene_type:complete
MEKNFISKKVLREFGLLIGLGLPFLIGWLLPTIFGHSLRLWTLFISIPFLLLGIFKPHSLFYPYKFWMKIGHVLGWINSRVILSLVFLLVLLPIALIMKLFSYDPLRRKKGDQNSYREKKINYKINLRKIF